MKPDDLISVVIPVFNRPEMILRAIDSVRTQTDARWELIVVDDGSDDETPQALGAAARAEPRMRIVTQPNRGVSSARNAGIKEAAGAWIALLDSDDVWRPEKLQRQRAWMVERPDYRICQCDERWVRNEQPVVRPQQLGKKPDWIFAESLQRCMVTPSTSLFEKALWEEVGRFDPDLPACEDYDFWLRIAHTWPIGLAPFVGADRHAGHDDQLSERYEAMDRFRVRALEKLLGSGNLNRLQRLAATKTLEEKCAILAAGAEKRGNATEAERYRGLSEKTKGSESRTI